MYGGSCRGSGGKHPWRVRAAWGGPCRVRSLRSGASAGTMHRFGTSFGTTYGVAYASCKLTPLRHVNTDVFVSTLRVVRALLREHER